MDNDLHFSSDRNDWGTPDSLYGVIQEVAADQFGMHIALDVAASARNAKCKRFITQKQDALKTPWRVGSKEACFCNPPYNLTKDFIERAFAQSKEGFASFSLIASRTDTRVWQTIILPSASAVFFIGGRVKFKGAKDSAPFPSAVVYFNKRVRQQRIEGWGLSPDERGF